MQIRLVQTTRRRQLRGKSDRCRGRIGNDVGGSTGAFSAEQFRDPRCRLVQLFAQARAKLLDLSMQSSDLLLPPGAQVLQQPDMAFHLTFRTGSSGEFRKDIHVSNFSGAFAEAAQRLQYRIRDAGVIEGESPESRFKAAGTCPQIVNLFGRGVAVKLL